MTGIGVFGGARPDGPGFAVQRFFDAGPADGDQEFVPLTVDPNERVFGPPAACPTKFSLAADQMSAPVPVFDALGFWSMRRSGSRGTGNSPPHQTPAERR